MPRQFASSSSSSTTTFMSTNSRTRSSGSGDRMLCRFYNHPGGCVRGNHCRFLHIGAGATLDEPARLIVNPLFNAINPTGAQCKFFKQGTCTRGSQCAFVHTGQPMPTAFIASSSPPSPSTSSLPKSVLQSSHQASKESKLISLGSTENHAEDEIICAICFEKPTTFGLLPECDHIFCLDCVRQWRNRTNKTEALANSTVIRECPVCRTMSSYVIPTPIHPNSPDLKEDIMTAYKDRVSKIPCRYFMKSSVHDRRCPFGDECLYRHDDSSGRRVTGVRAPVFRRNRHVISEFSSLLESLHLIDNNSPYYDDYFPDIDIDLDDFEDDEFVDDDEEEDEDEEEDYFDDDDD